MPKGYMVVDNPDESDDVWNLLKAAVRLYVKNTPMLTLSQRDQVREIYVGVNFGAANGADERHLAYVEYYAD